MLIRGLCPCLEQEQSLEPTTLAGQSSPLNFTTSTDTLPEFMRERSLWPLAVLKPCGL